jgi:cobalamin biosynthesis Mg chelatase CobN
MIIGETFNNDYDGYEEDNYDYLFKRKTKEERQQRKADNKQKRADRKQQKQDPTSGSKRRHPLLGNFGLFDKNKKKNTIGTSGTSTSSSSKKEPGSTSESSTSEEKKTAMAGAAAMQNKSEGDTPGSESAAQGTEAAKLEMKELDKNGKPKEAGFGPMVGFAFLGITILLVGIAVFKAGKRPISELQPMRVAA